MYFDPMYFVFALPALLFGLWAQWRVKSALKKYSQERVYSRMSGAEIARRILDSRNLQDVRVEPTQGFLSDHYDPSTRVLRLSPQVYQGNSVAAAGIAAHETGHALQHAEGYTPLQIRTFMVPTVQIGSWLGPIIFMVGLFTTKLFGTTLAWVGLALFGATALFALVTLPVELDASKRAKEILTTQGFVFQGQLEGVSRVLNAAALTYVAAAVQSLSTLMYYAFLLTGISRDN
jgi:Zn-dependent membrane protease YugP